MNKEELRKRIEDQVELEKRAHQHVQTMVLTECVGNDIFQTVVRMCLLIMLLGCPFVNLVFLGPCP